MHSFAQGSYQKDMGSFGAVLAARLLRARNEYEKIGHLHRVNEAPTWLPMETAQAEMSMRFQELFAKVAEMLPQMQRNACKLDRESEFPTTEVEQLVAGGALAAVVPVRYGGLGMGTESSGALHLFDLLRLIGRGNLAVGRIFEGHVNAIALVALYGSEKQLAQASQDALSGHLFAIWNTEPPEGLRIVGRELTGSKIFCSAAGHATRAMVTAKDENGESRMRSCLHCNQESVPQRSRSARRECGPPPRRRWSLTGFQFPRTPSSANRTIT